MENNGVYYVTLKNEKYVIVYVEKGLTRNLASHDVKYGFDDYNIAVDFIKNNSEELDKVVSSIKDKELRKIHKANEDEEKARNGSLTLEEEKSKKEKSKGNKILVKVIAAYLAGILSILGIKIGADAIKDYKANAIVTSEDELDAVEIKDGNVLATKFREFLVKKGIISCVEMKDNKVAVTPLKGKLTAAEIKALAKEFFTDKLFTELLGSLDIEAIELTEESKVEFCRNYLISLGIEVDALDISADIENIATAAEELTTENFEELVANLAKPYVENKLSLTTEDLTKFDAIMLIDRLSEENPELVQQLFSTQSEEEFLNDAGKVIGVTYMYDHNLWNTKKSTENFIWISAGIPEDDPQRESMELIEDYVKRIALAAKENDADKVNEIAGEFIEALTNPVGSLNALDDGTEFGAQVYIALINNSIGRNYLNKEYRDYFNVRSTSETNVSNILTVIRGCTTEANIKTLK